MRIDVGYTDLNMFDMTITTTILHLQYLDMKYMQYIKHMKIHMYVGILHITANATGALKYVCFLCVICGQSKYMH